MAGMTQFITGKDINARQYYDVYDAVDLGYMALFISICKKKSADDSMRAMGILPHQKTKMRKEVNLYEKAIQ